MTGLPWDASYQDGPAPWDVGRPQPAIEVEFAVGMRSGWSVWGARSGRCWTAGCSTPSTPTSARGTWRAWRRRPASAGLSTCCASATLVRTPDRTPSRHDELRAAFGPSDGWDVVAIAPDRVLTRFHDNDGAPAWLATIERI